MLRTVLLDLPDGFSFHCCVCRGLMHLDYVSADRPALGKAALPDAELQAVLRAQGVLGSSPEGPGWVARPPWRPGRPCAAVQPEGHQPIVDCQC